MKNLIRCHPIQNLQVNWKYVQDPWVNWNSIQEALFVAHEITPPAVKLGHPGT
jgi:hypothetical protein